MKRALNEMHVEGIETNIPFHLKVLDDKSFKKGDIDTTFIAQKGIVDKLRIESEKIKKEMTRTVAIISAALTSSEGGITNYLKVDKKVNEPRVASKWKMAGRNRQISRRPPR
jgi:pyruvate carboxylase